MNTVTTTGNEKFEVDGLEMWADYTDGDSVTIWMDGGFGQDHEGAWWEMDGNYRVAVFEIETNRWDDEITITLTEKQIEAAHAYRAMYPVEIEE